jgi:hypothetical protein
MGLHEVNFGSILVIPHKVIVGFLLFCGQDQKMEDLFKEWKNLFKI